MNRPIRFLAVACLVMFVALLANANFVQFVQADSLNDREGNRRVLDEDFSRDRGPILVGGEPIAESVASEDEFRYQRRYPEGPLYAPVTGYFSYIWGRRALEQSQNPVLSGSDNRLFVNRVVDLLAGEQPEGGSVELTLDPLAQKTAAQGLRDLGESTRGAVVALQPGSGAILAMVTQPSYDPNQLASHDFAAVQRAYEQLQKAPNDPLTNRASEQILPPGSTFKLVTAAAAIEELRLGPDDEVKAGATLSFPGIDYQLVNEGGSDCGGERITFRQALDVSCNTAFGGLAGEVGQEALAEKAEDFGFGSDVIEALTANPSQFTSDGTDLEAPQLAQSGIGQFEVAATPLQMAMVTAGVANSGEVMRPYLVDTVRAPSLRVLDETEAETLSQAMEPGDADVLTDMLVSVVEQGTASSAAISGIDVAAKTGTAQSTPDRPPYAWFVSFAPADDPQVAVAVVVESSDTARSEIAGGRLAGPIARSVMEAVLDR